MSQLQTLGFPAVCNQLLPGDAQGWRSQGENRYRAKNDIEAVFAWMEEIVRSYSSATAQAFISDVEKFALWSVGIRNKPMSSMTPGDFESFFQFLSAPTQEWIESSPYLRMDPAWRPFRKPLSPASCRRALNSLRRLYRDWKESGYLTYDPIALAKYRFTSPPYLWMTNKDWDCVWSALDALPESPESRRLRASLLLLRRGPMTLNEVTKICFDNVEESFSPEGSLWIVKLDNHSVVIDVTTRQAVEAHCQDRLELMQDGSLSRILGVPVLKFPLIGPVFHGPMREVSRRSPRMPSHLENRSNPTALISARSLRISIMKFMKNVANSPDMNHDSVGFLDRADRWLRSPKHQTEDRRQYVLVQKILGNKIDDVLDKPENEQIEMARLARSRIHPF